MASYRGSSPLTRGKLGLVLHGLHGTGLIPTHAGKTPGSSRGRPSSRAHPRSRGENRNRSYRPSSNLGSSPLTRGKRAQFLDGGVLAGLIPTPAGKTHASASVCCRSRAHPRSCGENVSQPVHPCGDAGSSPLMRGKRAYRRRWQRAWRLIPTHTGKTSSFSWLLRRSAAHPHSRGENPVQCGIPLHRTGSSPLTQGKPQPVLSSLKQSGLIPAHAGKTGTASSRSSRPRAHPRSRGENSVVALAYLARRGSSPLTRGKPFRVCQAGKREGLIPAHAGKTHWESPPARPPRAHPRSRGENLNSMVCSQPP